MNPDLQGLQFGSAGSAGSRVCEMEVTAKAWKVKAEDRGFITKSTSLSSTCCHHKVLEKNGSAVPAAWLTKSWLYFVWTEIRWSVFHLSLVPTRWSPGQLFVLAGSFHLCRRVSFPGHSRQEKPPSVPMHLHLFPQGGLVRSIAQSLKQQSALLQRGGHLDRQDPRRSWCLFPPAEQLIIT